MPGTHRQANNFTSRVAVCGAEGSPAARVRTCNPDSAMRVNAPAAMPNFEFDLTGNAAYARFVKCSPVGSRPRGCCVCIHCVCDGRALHSTHKSTERGARAPLQFVRGHCKGGLLPISSHGAPSMRASPDLCCDAARAGIAGRRSAHSLRSWTAGLQMQGLAFLALSLVSHAAAGASYIADCGYHRSGRDARVRRS